MKRAEAPIVFHLNSNLDDATNNTATTVTLPLDSERPFHNETEKTELNILLDKRTDFIKKLMSVTENGLPNHIGQALLRDAAFSDANWHMRSMGIPSRVASEMDRVVGQPNQAILGVGDLTVAQAKQLFIPMREGRFGLSSAELQSEPAMTASWASCAARVTARVGLGCVEDLPTEIPGLRSALPKLQAIRREAGDDLNDLARLGSTATSQRALSRVNKAIRDLRDHIGTNSKHRVALDSANGLAPLDSSSSPSPTPRLCTTPACDCANPFATRGTDARTGHATEPSAEPPWTRKANTRRRAHAGTPSPRGTTRCETKLRTLRDEPAYVQTSKSLWTTLPLIPKTARAWT